MKSRPLIFQMGKRVDLLLDGSFSVKFSTEKSRTLPFIESFQFLCCYYGCSAIARFEAKQHKTLLFRK